MRGQGIEGYSEGRMGATGMKGGKGGEQKKEYMEERYGSQSNNFLKLNNKRVGKESLQIKGKNVTL